MATSQHSVDQHFATKWQRTIDNLSSKNLTLERISQAYKQLAIPKAPIVYSVAGTNGKGSCAWALTDLHMAAGSKVGTFTSPHMHSVRERIQINREPIPAARMRDLSDELSGFDLTFFEELLLIALIYFEQEGVQVQVIEAGVGGRFDATNVLSPDTTIITSISHDHNKWLGPTLAHIAYEKSGLMRAGKPVVLGSNNPILQLRACALGSPVVFAHNARAQAIAAASFHLDVIPDFICKPVLGRNQPIKIKDKEFIVDVAHNPAAAERLNKWYPEKKLCIWASKEEKDLLAIVKCMDNATWIVPNVPHTAEVETLASALTAAGQEFTVVPTLADAIDVGVQHNCVRLIFGGFAIASAAIELGGRLYLEEDSS